MKTIVLAIAALAIAAPAYAQYNQQQGGWDSQTDAFGTHSTGNGANQGWRSDSHTDSFGTHTFYNGPQGQRGECNTTHDSFGSHTTCN